MAGKFELYKDKAGKFRFRLKASNGQVIAVGEAYETKASAAKGIESVRKNAAARRSTTRPDPPHSTARVPRGQPPARASSRSVETQETRQRSLRFSVRAAVQSVRPPSPTSTGPSGPDTSMRSARSV